MKIMRMLGIKGQSTAEYAIIIGVIVAMVIAMQTYVKRGMQGRFRDASDNFYNKVTGDTTNWGVISSTTVTPLPTNQYEPESLSSQSTQNVIEDWQKTDLAKEGTLTRESIRKTKQAAEDYQTQDYP